MTEDAKRWLEKYYPIKAENVVLENATQHALQKWYGLNDLGDFGLRKRKREIVDRNANPIIVVDSESCSYCHLYYFQGEKTYPDDWCVECPIKKEIGYPCDLGRHSPYREWLHDGNPQPMISILESIHRKEQAYGKT